MPIGLEGYRAERGEDQEDEGPEFWRVSGQEWGTCFRRPKAGGKPIDVCSGRLFVYWVKQYDMVRILSLDYVSLLHGSIYIVCMAWPGCAPAGLCQDKGKVVPQ